MTLQEVTDELHRLIIANPGKSISGLSALSGLSASRVYRGIKRLSVAGRIEIRNRYEPEHGTTSVRSWPVST